MDAAKVKSGCTLIFLLSGFLIALMSVMENYWAWLASLCGVFGQGCLEAGSFTFLKIPISFWGVGYYLVLIVLNHFKPSWMFRFVMAGAGVEITLLKTMHTMNLFCIFCIANAAAMVVLFALFLKKDVVWQCISILLIGYILSDYIVVRENITLRHGAAQKAGILAFGNPDAPVTVVEYSDYMCPACRNMHPVANIIKEMYKDKIRWVFRDFPLRQHKGADRLAEAARCAGEQGKFREFQDMLFDAKEYPDVKKFAKELGLNESRFAGCFDTAKYAPSVRQDVQNGTDAGIHSTPTFIINGQAKKGMLSVEQFKQLIDEALKQTEK